MSSGDFAEWQPRYAEHGIAIFPVRGKQPAIKGYLALGLSGSRKLVDRFGQEPAFGLEAEMAWIVVVDVDTPDERVLADALDRHGPTPFIVRSGGGNHQAWYRRTDERRSIRPDPSLPIDILGRGVIVAPPSIGAKGSYQLPPTPRTLRDETYGMLGGAVDGEVGPVLGVSKPAYQLDPGSPKHPRLRRG